MFSVKYTMATLVAGLLLLGAGAVGGVACPARCNSCNNQVVNCSRVNLNAPIRAYPEETKELDLSHNYIRVLGMRTFSNLASLEVLRMPFNNIVSLRNDAFKSFPNLQTLDLTGNRIYRIFRRSLRHVPQLRTLTLNKNRIRNLLTIFEYVPNLFQLNLAHNRLSSIGENDLKTLQKLQHIDFQDNRITSIHKDAFKNLLQLRYVFLGRNPLTNLPAMNWGSRLLQMLDISRCNLTAVPRPLPPSLGDLRLNHNAITSIQHTDFSNMTNLQMLGLNDNGLTFLADGTFSELEHLAEVWLRNNRLVYIPRQLPDNLRRLHMDSNQLQEIEANLFTENSLLDELNVERNLLTRIPTGTFTGLRFLHKLNFQQNQIQEIESRAFSGLGSLAYLHLSANPITRIHDEAFHQLHNLSKLEIGHTTKDECQLDYNFLPEMLRLKELNLINSPGLAHAFLDYINDAERSRDVMNYVHKLDLSFNNLVYLNPRVIEVFPSLSSAIIEGNNFQCTQRLRWLGDWIKRVGSTVIFGYYEAPICERPSRLSGQRLADLAVSEWASESELDSDDRLVVERANYNELQADGGKEVYADAGWEAELNRDEEWSKISKEKKIVKKKMSPEEKKKRQEKRRKRKLLRKMQKQKRKGKKGKGKKERKGSKKNRKSKGKQRNKNRKRKHRRGKGRKRLPTTPITTIRPLVVE